MAAYKDKSTKSHPHGESGWLDFPHEELTKSAQALGFSAEEIEQLEIYYGQRRPQKDN